jgi:hypothetical protein
LGKNVIVEFMIAKHSHYRTKKVCNSGIVSFQNRAGLSSGCAENMVTVSIRK